MDAISIQPDAVLTPRRQRTRERLIDAAFDVFAEEGVHAAAHHVGALIDSVDLNGWVGMSIQRAIDTVNNRLQNGLAFLATVGSTAPFVGLFGTVWGIMDAFYGIGLKGAGDIGALAPGLAAALICTVSGLFVAIPAVIAYNYFADKIRDIAIRCDSFSMEFLSYLERNLLRRKS